MIPLWLRLVLLVGVVLAALAWVNARIQAYGAAEREEGRREVRQAMTTKALEESQAKAKETLRRLEAQQRNQDAQDAEVARLRDAAARNAADADRVREQSTAAAREWAARLADSPTAQDIAAAGAAIAVCTDVRGRLDAAAGELARYAGAARSAGLKCERDYDALKPPP